MSQAKMTRAYAIGLGYGCVWLVAVCLAFGMLDMYGINTTLQGTVFSMAGLLIVGGALLYLCIRFLRMGYALPCSDAGRISVKRSWLFRGLIALEVVGWITLDSVLGIQNLYVWIVPVNLLIVGAHFIPLAFVFNVPAYLVMGILWIVAIVGSMLLLPSTTIIGRIGAWTTIPSICCIIITWLIVLFLVAKESKSVWLAAQIV
jgi:hypothetical protein